MECDERRACPMDGNVTQVIYKIHRLDESVGFGSFTTRFVHANVVLHRLQLKNLILTITRQAFRRQKVINVGEMRSAVSDDDADSEKLGSGKRRSAT